MNGAASSELSAMHPTTKRSAGSPRTKRAPSRIDRRIDTPPTWRGRRQVERRHHREDREEAERVEEERELVAAEADDEPGQRGPDDPTEVPLRRRQRDRAGEVFARDEVGEHRLERGEADRVARSRHRARSA